jgi:uncharacterized protein YpuA (DUF1002 family)
LLSFLFLPTHLFAKNKVGETVVTLGANLTPAQKAKVLKEMSIKNNVQQITVTNKEEHKYLGNFLEKSTIGTRSISSAKITIAPKGKGIAVRTKNITKITESMYANAAITAGIKDADIFVNAPFQVSGTAGLTGIIKAFEVATGQKLDENQKMVANEEMVRTSQIGQFIKDPDKAAKFMNRIKEAVSKKKPETTKDYTKIIHAVSSEYNIHLNDQTVEHLIRFTQNFSNLNVNWDSLQDQFTHLRGKIDEVLNDDLNP